MFYRFFVTINKVNYITKNLLAFSDKKEPRIKESRGLSNFFLRMHTDLIAM